MMITCLNTISSYKNEIFIWTVRLNIWMAMDFCLFLKNMGKSLSNKYGQKCLDSVKKSTTDAIKTASKRAIQKTAEVTGDLIGNKIADKKTSI